MASIVASAMLHHHLILQPQANGDRAPQHSAHTLRVGNGFSAETQVVEDGCLSLIGDVYGLRSIEETISASARVLRGSIIKDAGIKHVHVETGMLVRFLQFCLSKLLVPGELLRHKQATRKQIKQRKNCKSPQLGGPLGIV